MIRPSIEQPDDKADKRSQRGRAVEHDHRVRCGVHPVLALRRLGELGEVDSHRSHPPPVGARDELTAGDLQVVKRTSDRLRSS